MSDPEGSQASSESLPPNPDAVPVPPVAAPPVPSAPKGRKRPTSLIAIVAAGILILAVASLFVFRSASPSGLEKAADTCGLVTTDGGKTVTITITILAIGGPADGIDDWNCLVTNLPVPHYVQQSLGNATSLSGPITVSWDKYTATATYNGIDKVGSYTIHEN